MKIIHSVNYKNETREELLPGFDPDFLYGKRGFGIPHPGRNNGISSWNKSM